MAYLGNAPARSFISFERQVFTIVNSQTAYTLSHSVTNENDIRLVVNNVVQEPGSGKAYTATGTALTLSAALTNGTDEMYCVFLGRATATNAPGAGSVGTSQLASDSVTLAKMASGTDGNIISYDASGNPVAVATGSAGQILTSAGAGAPPTFAAAGVNTAVFSARIGSSGSESLANNTETTIPFGGEEFDPDNVFDASSTYKFTAPSAGRYYFNWCVRKSDFTAARFFIDVYVNNAAVATFENGGGSVYGSIGGSIILNLLVNETVYGKYTQNSGSSQNISRNNSRFCGYKLIE